MDFFLNLLLGDLLPTLIPVIIGIMVPYIMRGVKFFAAFVDDMKAPYQQMIVTFISWGLVQIGIILNMILPTDIELLTAGDLSGALAAAIAFAVHAGSKKSG